MKTMDTTLPFNEQDARRFQSEESIDGPFYVYDEQGIRRTARELNSAFDQSPDYKNFFAVKALPNPRILQILKEEGMGADCSSLAELEIANHVGMTGEDIFFTSNGTKIDEYERALELGAIINFDDISHIDLFKRQFGELPEIGCMRYNPEEKNVTSESESIIGGSEESKFGNSLQVMVEGYKKMKAEGVQRFGVHAMLVSNETNPEAFRGTAEKFKELIGNLEEAVGIEIEFTNLGGGIGLQYEPDKPIITADQVADNIYSVLGQEGRIITENGRFVTGPHGYLITNVLHTEEKYRKYAKVDACMANLMRPGMYGSYHHLTVLGKGDSGNHVYDVAGSLCEGNDKFAINRSLPEIEVGDILAIHSAGAHGHSMGFNYNGKLRCPEYLFDSDTGKIELIRRGETLEDYFSTLPDNLNPIKNPTNSH